MDAGDGDNESPNKIKTKLKNVFLSCFHPKTENTLPEPQQAIDNWVEAVDFPQAHPNDSINDLRRKVAIILESFFKNNPREPDTFLDIAQRLALECKESSGEGATREDFLRLLQNLQDTTHPVYLKALKSCERHPR